jgi:hypothetical protein
MADPTPTPPAERPAEPANLAEHRARKIDPAELAELARRLDATELEVGGLRAAIDVHERRNERIAAVLIDAADATRLAREELDREIEARHAAEAALEAERLGREAAERALYAERGAREAARLALHSERLRALDHESAAQVAIPVPAAGFPVVPSAPTAASPAETDELLAGLARAAERLRAQAPPVPEAPVAAPAPAAVQTLPPAPQWQVVPARPARTGGLIGALERLLRGRA